MGETPPESINNIFSEFDSVLEGLGVDEHERNAAQTPIIAMAIWDVYCACIVLIQRRLQWDIPQFTKAVEEEVAKKLSQPGFR